MHRVSNLISIGLCLCLNMGLIFARALPRADSSIPTTGGGDTSLNAGIGAIDSASTTSATSTSSSSSPTSTEKDGSPGSVSVEVWGPLVGIVAVIALMTIYTCFRKNNMNASMITATRLANEAAAANGSSQSNTGTATGRRRPRRTPSQVSTRSLPAYMQDPGDQEIVLARGRLRRNRSRPDMPGETDDEYDSGDEDDDMDDMDEHDRSLSQSDRPLLASSGALATGTGGGEDRRLAPPARYNSRGSTSFDTMRMGSEDSRHALLRDEPDDMDRHDDAGEGGTTYVFGEGATGLYDERDNVEEHVEMRELGGGGVTMGSASSSSSAGSVSGGRATQQQQGASSSSPRRTTTATTTPQPKPSFFSSISAMLGNSLSSVAHSLSGMNAPMSGAVIGGASYNALGDRSQQWGPRADAAPPSSDGANVRRHNTDATVSSVTTYQTAQTAHSGSALLAPPPPPPPSSSSQLPPPYESNNAPRSSMETTTTTTSRPRSQSRSSVLPTAFSRSRSRSGSNTNNNPNTNPSSSTLSLNNNNTNPASHIRSPSSTSLSISAPLAHTVTKSTFMYPASGPTTDQIKFLSSREALGRFGMPYGHEAVAAAARARVITPTNANGNDEAPPPSFEDIAGGSSSNNSGIPSTPSSTQNPSSELTQMTTSPISSPSDSIRKSPSQYGPKRTDSVASRTSSIRSNRSIAGPRGPRTSVRRSTLPAGGVVGVGVGGEDVSRNHIDRERTPRPSMDSIETVDSMGIETKQKNHSALEQMEDMAFWATAAERVAADGGDQPSSSSSQTQTQPRRSTLQSLPKLVVDNTSTQSSILPLKAPRGFVMSSPPASPTPTTSTNPHANDFNELGVPVITFAPATPSADSHGHGHVG